MLDRGKLMKEFLEKKEVAEVEIKEIPHAEKKEEVVVKTPRKTKKKTTKALTPFEKYKKEYMESENGADVSQLIELNKKVGSNIFDLDTFLKIKFEHPESKVVVVDPTLEEMKLGKAQTFYIIKPMYSSEYTEFVKKLGSRDLYPVEFMRYMMRTCVLFPSIKESDVEKMSAGKINILYSTCLQFSTFNTTFKIVEV